MVAGLSAMVLYCQRRFYLIQESKIEELSKTLKSLESRVCAFTNELYRSDIQCNPPDLQFRITANMIF